MAHARQQIRAAAVTALTGLATTGDRVWASRVRPFADAHLPGLAVYTLRESARNQSAARTQMRSLELLVDARVKVTGSFDDDIDQICAEVEAALLADVTLGGLAFDTVLADTAIMLSGEADKPVGQALLRFTVTYQTQEGAPGTAL